MDKALADMSFLDRVQSSFEIGDMTETRLHEWLYHGESGKHKVRWGADDRGKQRYKEVEGKPISSKTIRLAEKLSVTKEIYDLAGTTKEIRGFERLIKRENEIYVHKVKVSEEITIKSREFIEEKASRLTSIKSLKNFALEADRLNMAGIVDKRIQELGVVTLTSFTRELRRAKDEGQIQEILRRGGEQLTETQLKNLQEQAEFKKRALSK